MHYEDVRDLLNDLGWDAEGADCVVVTRAEEPVGTAAADRAITWLRNPDGGPIPAPGDRRSVAVVFDQFDAAKKKHAGHLLAQLRDSVAEKTVVRDNSRVFSATELLALGFVRERRPRAAGRFFVHDPALFYEPRDWNNPEHWAHPENFDKFRF